MWHRWMESEHKPAFNINHPVKTRAHYLGQHWLSLGFYKEPDVFFSVASVNNLGWLTYIFSWIWCVISLLLYNEKEEVVSAPPYVLDYAFTNNYYSKKYKIYLQYQLMRTSCFLVVQVWMMMMMCWVWSSKKYKII